MNTDPIADMLTRIRNGNQAVKHTISMPSSKVKTEVAKILAAEGFIDGFNRGAVRESYVPFSLGPERASGYRYNPSFLKHLQREFPRVKVCFLVLGE